MNAVYVRHFHCSFALLGGARVDLVDQDGHSLLHWAALGGNADVCQILIENKINPNVQDYAGRTPLQCAAYGGYINCMAVLMENSADPNIQDKEVETQVFCAASSLCRAFSFAMNWVEQFIAWREAAFICQCSLPVLIYMCLLFNIYNTRNNF